MKLVEKLLDIIYPVALECRYCNSRRQSREIKGLCKFCLEEIDFVVDFCDSCGRQLPERITNICQFCKLTQYSFEQARAVALYQGKIEDLLLQFKYEEQKKLAFPLGQLLLPYYYKYFYKLNIQGICYVPLHKERILARGFNQSELLARQLAEYTEIKLYENLIFRSEKTPPLYKLSYQERKQVVKNAFSLKNGDLCYGEKNILLVDDIFTTGSTVNEISRLLKAETGVEKIYVLTLATATA